MHVAPYICKTRLDHSIIIKYYIGAAAFASEENETLVLPANGGSVSFNATVIYKPGGSCNYRQSLNLIKLKKINESKSEIMYICRFDRGSCTLLNEKTSVNLSRGHSGSEFVLTLFNLTTDSIGTYEVFVDLSNPHTGGTSNFPLIKRFHLVGK